MVFERSKINVNHLVSLFAVTSESSSRSSYNSRQSHQDAKRLMCRYPRQLLDLMRLKAPHFIKAAALAQDKGIHLFEAQPAIMSYSIQPIWPRELY